MSTFFDSSLHDLLAERVGAVLSRLPADVDPESVFSQPEVHPEQLRDPEFSRALGWVEGLADALDLTVLELLSDARFFIGSRHDRSLR